MSQDKDQIIKLLKHWNTEKNKEEIFSAVKEELFDSENCGREFFEIEKDTIIETFHATLNAIIEEIENHYK